MKDKPADPESLTLARWSRRKREAGVASRTPAESAAPPQAAPAALPARVPAPPSAPVAAASELPSIDSLGFDSDFTAFLRPEVDETLKRAALKQLFRDPRFNVMDGLDVYIDDYTKADPIAPDILKGLLKRGFSADSAPAPATPPVADEGATPATSSLPAAAAPTAAPASTSASADPEPARETAPEERKPGSAS
jgi:hypothetical protein